jgi:hypothetical protein
VVSLLLSRQLVFCPFFDNPASYGLIKFHCSAGSFHNSQKSRVHSVGKNSPSNSAIKLGGYIDPDTPKAAYWRQSFHDPSNALQLVFSDEFEDEGRSFYPGDDPFWEASDLHHWQTGDLERYGKCWFCVCLTLHPFLMTTGRT